jgi:hypothetical protein
LHRRPLRCGGEESVLEGCPHVLIVAHLFAMLKPMSFIPGLKNRGLHGLEP